MGIREPQRRRPARSRERGQARMEFAVVAIVLSALLAGVLEFGRIWNAVQVLNAAVRDGARLAATTDKNNQRAQNVKNRIQSLASAYFDKSKVQVTVNEKTTSSQPVITVTATGSLDTIFSNFLLGKSVDISRTMTVRDETVAGS